MFGLQLIGLKIADKILHWFMSLKNTSYTIIPVTIPLSIGKLIQTNATTKIADACCISHDAQNILFKFQSSCLQIQFNFNLAYLIG